MTIMIVSFTPKEVLLARAATSENEFQVECFDVETTRKEAKEKYPEFEEVR